MTAQKYCLPSLFVLMVCYLTTTLFSACDTVDKRRQVDVSAVPVTLRTVRFDQALFACDTNRLDTAVNALGNRYPDFSAVYFREITGFARNEDEARFMNSVRHFLTYKDYRGLYDTVQQKFPDTKDIDRQLEELFRHVKYYFPDQHLGDVYYFISGLNSWSAITVDTALGIGLDMYLGKDYPFYPSVQLPNYEILKCEKEYIPVNAAKVIYENMFPLEPQGKNLLDLMLLKGKQLLFMEYVLPKAKNELLMGYSPAQWSWCEDNEAMIWHYFSAQKLLYSTDWQDIMRYVNDGPTSTGMPPESPGNIGSWIGWQIIHAYMEKHPEASMTDILKATMDSQTFLRESGYRPR